MSSRARRQEKKRNKSNMGGPMSNEIEKPKDSKGTANEYWYKKPKGLIIIGVAIALISTAIIGIFNHLTAPILSNQIMSPNRTILPNQNIDTKSVPAPSSLTIKGLTLDGNNLADTGIENNNPNAQVIMKNSRIIGTKTGIRSNANNTQVIMDGSEIEAKQKGIDIHQVPQKK